jgi:hypothetical protein
MGLHLGELPKSPFLLTYQPYTAQSGHQTGRTKSMVLGCVLHLAPCVQQSASYPAFF